MGWILSALGISMIWEDEKKDQNHSCGSILERYPEMEID